MIVSSVPRYYQALRYIEVQPGDRVLDVGCGTAEFMATLSQDARITVIGVDRAEGALQIAKSGVERGHFVTGEMCALPFPDQSFDLVTCLDALEYIEHPEVALESMSRVLRPSGHLILSVPTGASCEGRLFFLQRLLRRAIPRAFYSKMTYGGKHWLEASQADWQVEDGCRIFLDAKQLRSFLPPSLRVVRLTHSIKLLTALAADLTYGVRGLGPLKPWFMFASVRADTMLRNLKKGYLLVVQCKKRSEECL